MFGSSVVALIALVGSGAVRADDQREVTMQGPLVTIRSLAMPRVACRPEKPIMPEQARLMDISGTVLVDYTVYEDGHVGDISLAKSTAHPVLAEAVRSWLESCSFTAPQTARNTKVPLRFAQPYVFRQR
jgi:TonB family protein